MAGSPSRSPGVTLVPPPWTDALHSALGAFHPAHLNPVTLIDCPEPRR